MLLQRDSGRNEMHCISWWISVNVVVISVTNIYDSSVIQFLFREMNNPYGLAQNSSSASISLYFCDFAIQ